MADDTRPILGIDLGTTHTVAAFHEGGAGGAGPTLLPILQPIDAHAEEPRDLLPSVLFVPVDDEAPDRRHPADRRFLYGEHARRRGAEAPPRLIASAKSWLCNPSVDRDAALLPWGSNDDTMTRLSPIDASALTLRTVAAAYLSRGGRAVPRDAAELTNTEVVLTIPASFDDGARELTVLAAERAGLVVKLVEEPTAAFHDWLWRHGEDGLVDLLAGRPEIDVLVVDVGGGTTDLSLLRVAQAATTGAAPSVTRIAVSDHLLLGGDNMDLALAHRLEPTFSGLRDERLDPLRFGELCQAVRRAKETLLSAAPPPEAIVTLLGRGSKLLGGAKSAPLTTADVAELLLEGFFPIVERDARPTMARGGLRAAGLPYARDPAISRHLAAFLGRPDVRVEHAARPLCVLPASSAPVASSIAWSPSSRRSSVRRPACSKIATPISPSPGAPSRRRSRVAAKARAFARARPAPTSWASPATIQATSSCCRSSPAAASRESAIVPPSRSRSSRAGGCVSTCTRATRKSRRRPESSSTSGPTFTSVCPLSRRRSPRATARPGGAAPASPSRWRSRAS